MNWIALLEKLFASRYSAQSNNDSVIVEVLDAARLLRSAGSALSAQAALHGQLARVEWAEEKSRLLQMAVMMLLGFTCALCIMIFTGVLVIAFSWDTPYRIHSLIALIAIYATGLGIALHKLQVLAARSSQAFIATREELAADIALLRSKL